MKLFKVCAVSALATGSLAAQGVFDIAPNEGFTESLPLKITGSVNYGWDDNVTPTDLANRNDEASYVSANVAANYLNIGAQTHVDFSAKLGAIHYIDDIASSAADDTYNESKLILNVTHNVSERLRFSTRNYLFYGLEPDYNYGFVNDRNNSEYLVYSTDNAVGYKWNDRVGTYTGVKYDSLNYDSTGSGGDRDGLTVYNQFRYVLSPQAIGTLDYRYNQTDVNKGLDSQNQKILAGAEYRLNLTAVLIAKAGVQLREVDTRDSQSDPTFELGYIQRVNELFRLRGNLAYDVNDYGTSAGLTAFDNNQTLRIAVAGDYQLSQQITFTAGVNYVSSEFSGNAPTNTVDVVNAHIGGTYEIMDNLAATLTYNHTTSSDDSAAKLREYDRNRIQAGVTYTF